MVNDADGPVFVGVDNNSPKTGFPFVERQSITAIVRNPADGKYLGLRWHKVDWDTFVTGGIEEGQSAKEAARAEVREETGYKNLRLITELPHFHSKFYHEPKGENRFAHFHSFLFELIDDEQETISEEEKSKHEYVWLTPAELNLFRLPEGHRFLLAQITI